MADNSLHRFGPRFEDDADDVYASDGAVAVESVTDTKKIVKKPPLYRVILHNDDFTSMEFVVMILRDVFRHSEESAVQVMLQVHQRGEGVAGVYSYEIAETKIEITTQKAREREFPLRCTMEPQE
jgi:ATP-dependent Clp protease adaptor protein ClpS